MDNMITKTANNSSGSYVEDVKSMLFSFGDVEEPLTETAIVVEEIVKEQMNMILTKSAEAAELRGSKAIGYEDLIFLMRKNPIKVQRLMRYLGVLDDAIASLNPTDVQVDSKRVKRCKNFISVIDTNGLLIKASNEELYDEEKVLRLKRMDFWARNMDTKKYEAFTKSRQVGFLGVKAKNQQKFYNWVTHGAQDYLNGLKIEKNSLEILSYLAYETVGHIVDMAIICRNEMNQPVDTLDKTVSVPVSYNPFYPMVQLPDASNGLHLNGPKNEKETFCLLDRKPLKRSHVTEAIRRLSQMPFSVLEPNFKSTRMPILAI